MISNYSNKFVGSKKRGLDKTFNVFSEIDAGYLFFDGDYDIIVDDFNEDHMILSI